MKKIVNFKMKIVTFILMMYIFDTYSIREFFFHHQFSHETSRVSDCNTVTTQSISMCIFLCIERQTCLNFAFSKSEAVCRYNCRVFWSTTSTDTTFIFYERASQNIGKLKSTTVSSVWNNDQVHLPEFAVDGHLSSLIWGSECFHSSSEVSPWIQVDLEELLKIDYIKIYNRWDTLGDRLHNIKVQIDGSQGDCDDFIGPAIDSQVVFIQCKPNIIGRHVKLYIDGNAGQSNYLTICELEICQFT